MTKVRCFCGVGKAFREIEAFYCLLDDLERSIRLICLDSICTEKLSLERVAMLGDAIREVRFQAGKLAAELSCSWADNSCSNVNCSDSVGSQHRTMSS